MRALCPPSVIPTHRSDDLLRVKIKTYQTVHKMNQLSNKIALITGATSGIGRATALAFAAEGAKVVVTGRRQAEGEQVVAEIIANGGEAIFVQTDVSIESQAENAVNQTIESLVGSISFSTMRESKAASVRRSTRTVETFMTTSLASTSKDFCSSTSTPSGRCSSRAAWRS